jgi:hypothetical protein
MVQQLGSGKKRHAWQESSQQKTKPFVVGQGHHLERIWSKVVGYYVVWFNCVSGFATPVVNCGTTRVRMG